jgi:hypothetical protein
MRDSPGVENMCCPVRALPEGLVVTAGSKTILVEEILSSSSVILDDCEHAYFGE